LAANILASAFRGVAQWPIDFVQLYLDDSLNEHRYWVDDARNKPFVDEILTAFGDPVWRRLLMIASPLFFDGDILEPTISLLVRGR